LSYNHRAVKPAKLCLGGASGQALAAPTVPPLPNVDFHTPPHLQRRPQSGPRFCPITARLTSFLTCVMQHCAVRLVPPADSGERPR